jgi:hypothetical protein
MIPLAVLSKYNTKFEMYVSLCLLIVTLFLIFTLFRLDAKDLDYPTHILFVPIPWLLFILSQYKNLLWGWQIQIYFAIVGVMIALVALEYSRSFDWLFVIAIAGATFSSYSFMLGLATWPMGFLFLLISYKETMKKYVAWASSSAIVFGLYFWHWTQASSHSSVFTFLNAPLRSIHYYLVAVGSPASFQIWNATAIGVLLLSTAVIIAHRTYSNKIYQNTKWLALLAFVLGSFFALMIGRSGFGIQQALAPRYTSFAVLGFISLYFSSLNLGQDQIASFTRGAVLTIIIITILVGYPGGYEQGTEFSEQVKEGQYHLLTYQHSTDNQLEVLYSNVGTIRERVRFLERHELSVFNKYSNYLYNPVDINTLHNDSKVFKIKGFGGEKRLGIFEHPMGGDEATIRYQNVTVPQESELQFGLAVADGRGDGVRYAIDLQLANGSTKRIFTEYVNPEKKKGSSDWKDRAVDLSPYAGQKVDIILVTAPGPSGDGSYDWAWWGNVRITPRVVVDS